MPRLTRPIPSVPVLTTALLVAGVVACSRGESRPVMDTASAPSAPREPRPELGVVDPVHGAYVAREVTDGGSVVGTVTIAGAAPVDTSIPLDSTVQRACRGPSMVDRTIQRRGARLAGAAVWLADVRSGKPLPLQRRQELQLVRCALVPRIQGVAMGGTLNVRSSDPLLTRLRFVRQPAGEVLRTIETNDAGQVVPDEQILSAPGLVEVRGERQPWLRAYVVVTDHPYVTDSDAGGAFTLSDVPPGTYQLVTWHERFGRVATPVTIRAGQPTNVTIVLGRDSSATRDSAVAEGGAGR